MASAGIVFNLGVILQTAATRQPLFIAGRFFAGLGVGLISAQSEWSRIIALVCMSSALGMFPAGTPQRTPNGILAVTGGFSGDCCDGGGLYPVLPISTDTAVTSSSVPIFSRTGAGACANICSLHSPHVPVRDVA